MIDIKISINSQAIQLQTKKAAQDGSLKTATKVVNNIFRDAKRRMLQSFDNHDVTVELQNGMLSPYGAKDKSGTTQGYGNLFSYFGFYEGYNPIAPLREIIKEQTTVRQTVRRNGIWYFRIELPSQQDIENVTPLPALAGVSWVEEVETGSNDNLMHYLNSRGKGQSQGGIQVKGEVNEDLRFNKRKYTSEIFKEFKESVLNI